MRHVPSGAKASHRVQLERAAAGGSAGAQAHLEALPECPDAAAHVWEWFSELHGTRTSSGFGPNALQETELAAFFANRRLVPMPDEVALLRMLDLLYLKHHARVAHPESVDAEDDDALLAEPPDEE